MGSEVSPEAYKEAINDALKYLPLRTTLVLYIHPHHVNNYLLPRVECVPVEAEISQNETPLSAVRKKRDASLVFGMNALNARNIDALISSGNTGAIVASASFYLERLPNIRKLPLAVNLCSKEETPCVLLDVGGTLECGPADYFQFAYLGSAYYALEYRTRPRVGLLNVGKEAHKGTPQLKEAYRLLAEDEGNAFTFIGNIEANHIFDGICDVIVTDGLSGNILLKTAEGCCRFLSPSLQQKEMIEKTMAAGAVLLGADGIVIKCHGDADPLAITGSILHAADLIKRNALEVFKRSVH